MNARMPRVAAAALLAACGAGCGSGASMGPGDAGAGGDGAVASRCPPGSLRISQRGWDDAGNLVQSLPPHGARDSYALGRVLLDGPTGLHDYLAALTLHTRTSPVEHIWIVKLIVRDDSYPSGTLDRDETLCLADLTSGVRWLDLGRVKNFTAGNFTIQPVLFDGHVIDVIGSDDADHILLMAGAGGAHVHAGGGMDVVIDETASGAELFGDEGNDVLAGDSSGGASVLHGGPGDDRLTGTNPANRYYGDDGDDCIAPQRTSADALTAEVIDGGDGTDESTFASDGARVLAVERDVRNTAPGYYRCGWSVSDVDGAEPWPYAAAEADLVDLVERARSGRLTENVAADAYIHASPDGASPATGSCPAEGADAACVFSISCVQPGCSGLTPTRGLHEAARMRVLDKSGHAPWTSPRFAGWTEDGAPAWSGTEWTGIMECPRDGETDTDGDGVPDLHDNPDDELWDVAAMRVGEAGEGFVSELVTCGASPDALSAFRKFLGSRPHCLIMFNLENDCTPSSVKTQHIGVGYVLQTESGATDSPAPLARPRNWWSLMLADRGQW